MTSQDERKTWSGVYDSEMDARQFLDWLQMNHSAWEHVNFPDSHGNVFHSLAGVTEELGELAHALLKDSQNIRGTAEEHDREGRDAVGDLLIYMAGLCNKKGWNMQRCVETAWAEVANRDWVKNKQDGVTA